MPTRSNPTAEGMHDLVPLEISSPVPIRSAAKSSSRNTFMRAEATSLARLRWKAKMVEAADAKTLVVSQKKPWFVIDPRSSSRIGYWDAITGMALVFTALVTPYEVAFLSAASSPLDPLFIINRVVDLIFLADMVVQFLLM
eukprot:6193142-Pleurochrysis_carterae.AAC.2